MIWNEIWRKSFDQSIEWDLRYDCSPLKSSSKPRKIDCNLDICLWDNFTFNNEQEQEGNDERQNNRIINCYYKMERDEDVDLDLMPRYIVVDYANNNNDQNIEKDEKFDFLLKLKTPPPFIKNSSNDNLNLEPIIYEKLSLSIRHYTEKHFSILIKPFDEDEKLWSKHLDYNYIDYNNSIVSDAHISVVDKNEDNGDYFELRIKRKSNDANLFNMGNHSPFVFTNGYIEMTILLINDLLYGLGQSNEPFSHDFTTPKQWHLFNQFHNNLTENSSTLFGSHPFFMGIDDTNIGNAYGVLLVNTFPIQVITNARPSLTLRATGGHLEFHYFLGPKPNEVIQQMLNFIHKPAMPPYWSLGFHMCHTKCSLPEWQETIGKLRKIPVPIESDCGTSLRLSKTETTTEMVDFVEKLHQENMRWLSSITPHLTADDKGELNEKWRKNVLLKSSRNKDNDEPVDGKIVGCLIEDRNQRKKKTTIIDQKVFYPDFFNKNTENLLLNDNNNLVNYRLADGFILDLNTPVNLANTNRSCNDMLQKYKWNRYYFAKLNEMNLCMDTKFSNMEEILDTTNHTVVGPYLALHNIYGLKYSKIIYENFLKKSKKRPFLMSLSTFLGSGRYGGHISTSINGTWSMLKYSLKQMLDLSLFGIPMSGFPVGGSKGEERKDSLMRQWYQLASMQPFMIAYSNLNEIDTPLLETLKNTIRSTVRTRYRILPYLYTLFYRASINGDLVAQPLFFQFPEEKHTYKIQNQFMLGSSLMISPSIDQDRSSLTIYFPKGRWYDFYSGHIAWNSQSYGTAEMSIVNINIHLRGGQMVMTQNSKELETIREIRQQNGFDLIVGYDHDNKAYGEFYMDNGDDPFPVKSYLMINFEANYDNFTIVITQKENFCSINQQYRFNTILESIKLFGVIDQPDHKLIHFFETDSKGELKHTYDREVPYDAKFGVLNIKTDLDFCNKNSKQLDSKTSEQRYFLSWTYIDW